MEQSDPQAIQMMTAKILQQMPHGAETGSNGLQRPGNAPAASLVDHLVEAAVQSGASDIHIEPQEEALRIRFRIDGRLCERHVLPLGVHAVIVSRIKIISLLDITEKRLPQDGRFMYEYEGQHMDVRVSTMPQLNGEKVVLRILNAARSLLDMNKLGFSAANRLAFEQLIHKPHGMILVSGPVNSGKTTTLYAALRALSSVCSNIVTLEDPVEYCLPGINQIPVGAGAKLTFPLGLRAVLRQDPDVIMVGEIRDAETAGIAIRAALTGHLVLTTVHTGDAVGSIFRLLDMGVESYLVADAIRGVLAQRLVRRLCPHCRKAYLLPADSPAVLFFGEKCRVGQRFFQAVGCSSCRQTGYCGRLAIHELLLFDNSLRQRLQSTKDMFKLQEFVSNQLVTMQTDGLEKAAAGDTSLDEVIRVTCDGK